LVEMQRGMREKRISLIQFSFKFSFTSFKWESIKDRNHTHSGYSNGLGGCN